MGSYAAAGEPSMVEKLDSESLGMCALGGERFIWCSEIC